MGSRLVILVWIVIGLSSLVRVSVVNGSEIQQQNNEPDSKLVKVAFIFRHGDRPPTSTYPTDPYPYTDLNHWPDGPGQLTVNGKKRMLRLGQLIREKYSVFFGENPIESYVRSSAVDRCLASAELVVAEVYPPTGRQVFTTDLNWQPIPIHSRNEETDAMLVDPVSEDCEAHVREKELQLQADSVQEYMEKHRDLVQAVEKGSGMNITSIMDMGVIYGILKCDKEAGKRLPDWITDDVMDEMLEMHDVSKCVIHSGKRIQRLEAGVLLHDLKKVFATPDPLVIDDIPRKIFFYSTHDARQIAILRSMGPFDGKQPNYGSSIIFEMHERDGNSFVRSYYLRDPMKEDGDIVPLTSSGCPTDSECSVQQFFSGLREFITDEETHRKECAIIPVVAEEVDCVK